MTRELSQEMEAAVELTVAVGNPASDDSGYDAAESERMWQVLLDLLAIESESGNTLEMRLWLVDYLESRGLVATEDEACNLYVTKGVPPPDQPGYPCVVSHVDTVHDVTGNGIVPVVCRNKIAGLDPETMWQVGIGGDDKCGIFAALYCLEYLPHCKAAFFVDEEIGCAGSGEADMDFFQDCRFVLQADRRGGTDFVTDIWGPLSSPEFLAAASPALERHGYRPCSGMMTDVMKLRDRKVGCSVANMSAGYHRPHSPSEYIDVTELYNACSLMLALCVELVECYPFVAPDRPAFRAKYKYRWSDQDTIPGTESKHSLAGPFGRIPSQVTRPLEADRSLLDAPWWIDDMHEDRQSYYDGERRERYYPDDHYPDDHYPDDHYPSDAELLEGMEGLDDICVVDAHALDDLSFREWCRRQKDGK